MAHRLEFFFLNQGPAAKKLMLNDRLLWVSGTPIADAKHADGVDALKKAPNSAELIVVRTGQDARQFVVSRWVLGVGGGGGAR